jgi:N-acetylglucosaminyl-diphospho-decaprenol L-rhamnosyltransferase
VRAAGYRVAIANRLRAVHVRGVSSASKPYWVELQKHRGLWRYFEKFEAQNTTSLQTLFIRLGLWSHFVAKCVKIFLQRIFSSRAT